MGSSNPEEGRHHRPRHFWWEKDPHSQSQPVILKPTSEDPEYYLQFWKPLDRDEALQRPINPTLLKPRGIIYDTGGGIFQRWTGPDGKHHLTRLDVDAEK